MTAIVRVLIAIALALAASSCAFDMNFGNGERGNGNVVSETRSVYEDFTVVSAAEGLDVFVSQGKESSIKVEADDNIIDLIRTDISNGKLRVHAERNIGRATKKIYVTLPEITGLESSSGADLVSENTLEVDKVNLSASSGSDLRVDVMADEIHADSSSGADIRISGKTQLLDAESSSGSDIKAMGLEAKVCHADASSGADISVNVSDELIAEATSGADIRYSGEPSVQKNKSASGSVRKN
ncbi:head GIN domain-containing protein [Sediminicola luteus]|uniref:DUF2807 domain-containing protein n=1 Tax=Sediminicola luteus TaxID=319238 RepID=A0A2A4GAB9_9FLAO|nr:head GIN domain-containing protein [Sediminicola luteus]PCE64695.1 DUF2807 domain-containing protein [Sediminicola luteus]